jgi:assimilatory nitrate reductase catalytic subunit
MIDSIPRFLNGAYDFTGAGYGAPALLDPSLVYTVPADKRAQLIYLRAGNSSPEMVFIGLMQDGKPVRLFPVGAKAAMHVPLAVVEDLQPDTRIEVFIGAPAGASGTAVVDLGLIEI